MPKKTIILPAKVAKDTYFHLRLTQAEKDFIKAKAKDCSMSTAQYVRQVSLGYKPKETKALEQIQEVIKVNRDLAKLSGLLKMWLSDRIKFSGSERFRMISMLKDIEITRLKLEMAIDKIVAEEI